VPRKKLTGILRLRAACANSARGLRDIWRGEEAFRLEAVVFVLSVPLGIWLAETALAAACLIFSVWLVLVVEVINSAIEAVVDRFGEEHHDLSRIAKDLGSLAVLMAMVVPAVVWCVALYDRVAG
jgi:diacylglycerol kinase (ATP)